MNITEAMKVIDNLKETNSRLNRRCQKAESLVVKYRRRYVAMQKPVEEVLNRLGNETRRVHNLYNDQFRDIYRYCYICRHKFNWKNKIRRWIKAW